MAEKGDNDNCPPPPLEYVFTSPVASEYDENSQGLDEEGSIAKSTRDFDENQPQGRAELSPEPEIEPELDANATAPNVPIPTKSSPPLQDQEAEVEKIHQRLHSMSIANKQRFNALCNIHLDEERDKLMKREHWSADMAHKLFQEKRRNSLTYSDPGDGVIPENLAFGSFRDSNSNICSRGNSDNKCKSNSMKLKQKKQLQQQQQQQQQPVRHKKAKHKAPIESVLVPKVTHRTSRITFSTIEIRQYERILGDNPSCSCGPPVSIGWKYNEDETVTLSVDDYEYRRPVRKESKDLTLGKTERHRMLLNLGYARKELTSAVRTNVKLKSQRRQTVNNLALAHVEETLEGATKKISRIMRKRRDSKYLYRKWRKSLAISEQGNKNIIISTMSDGLSSTGSLRSSLKKYTITATESPASHFISSALDKDSTYFEEKTFSLDESNM